MSFTKSHALLSLKPTVSCLLFWTLVSFLHLTPGLGVLSLNSEVLMLGLHSRSFGGGVKKERGREGGREGGRDTKCHQLWIFHKQVPLVPG